MALVLRRNPSNKVKIITTLIAVFALVAQPMYGMVQMQVAEALSLSVDPVSHTLEGGQTGLSNIAPSSHGELQLSFNYDIQKLDAQAGDWLGYGVRLADGSELEVDRLKGVSGDTDGEVGAVDKAIPVSKDNPLVAIYFKNNGNNTRENDDTAIIANIAVTRSEPEVKLELKPELVAENFNTVDDNSYKGVSVGFNAKNFKNISDVTVTMERAAEGSVAMKGTEALFELIESGAQEGKFTAPFVIQPNNYDSSNDIYWAVEPAVWTPESIPTSVTIKITAENGNPEVSNSPFLQNTASHPTYQSLLPPDTTAPTVQLDYPSHNSYVSGKITVEGSVEDDVKLSHYNLSIYPGEPKLDFSNGKTHSDKRRNKDAGWEEKGTLYTSGRNETVDRELDTTKLDDGGKYTIRLAARDAAGNGPDNGGSKAVYTVDITVDNTAPTMKLHLGENGGVIGSGSIINNTGKDIRIEKENTAKYYVTRPDGTSWHGGKKDADYRGGKLGVNHVFNQDGKYKFFVEDEAGNKSNDYTIIIDTQGPGLKVDDIPTLVGGKFNISGTAKDASGIRHNSEGDSSKGSPHVRITLYKIGADGFSMRDEQGNLITDSRTAVVKSDGTWSLEINRKTDSFLAGHDKFKANVKVYDNTGTNYSDANYSAKEVRFTVDHDVPELALKLSPSTGPVSFERDGVVRVAYGAENENLKSYSLTINGREVAKGGASVTDVYEWSLENEKSGDYTVVLTAEDEAGNVETTMKTITVDNTVPTVALPRSIGVVFGNTLNVAVDDVSDSYSYWVSSQDSKRLIEGLSHNSNLAIDVNGWKSGTYKLNAQATDEAGNKSEVKTVDFYVDHTAPVVRITSITPTQPSANSLVTLQGTATDNTAVTSLMIKVGSGAPVDITDRLNPDGTWSYATDALVEGTYTFIVTAYDGLQNNSGSDEIFPGLYVGSYAQPLSERLSSRDIPTAPTSSLVSAFAPEAVVEASDEETAAPDILGSESTRAPISDTAAIAATPQGWKIFGLGWYWIFLMALAAIVAVWGLLAARRRRLAADGAEAPFVNRRG